jgi:hypothetical protein
MTLSWESLVTSLGEEEASAKVLTLISDIDEVPSISDTPEEYNDPLGKTRFYKFYKSGLEIGFREDTVNHIHLFIQEQVGYSAYGGSLEEGVTVTAAESVLLNIYGAPSSFGGGKQSLLLDYRHKWIKFGKERYALRYEFSKDGSLRKISLILR